MQKTKKAVSKRFRITKNGKIKRANSGKRHLLSGKNRKRKRHLRAGAYVSPEDQNRIRRLLPHG